MSKGTLFLVTALTLLAAMGAEAADGDFVWAKRMGGTGADEGRGIALDSAGNVYTTGRFEGTVDFDPGAGTFTLTSAGDNDIFVSKLDSEGNFLWAKAMGGTSGDEGRGIALDSAGNVYTTGRFEGTADFDPGTGTFNLTSAGGLDIFVSKLDSEGNFAWAKAMGGTHYDLGYGIAVDSVDNVYIVGAFGGTADFDPGAGTFNLTSADWNDIFVSKLDSAGNFVWAKGMGGTHDDYGFGIAVDSASNVYTTGRFSDTVDFDPGAGTFNLTSAGGDDIFVSKLDSAGDFVWAKGMGGTGYGIAVDSAGNVYTTGSFISTADFDPEACAFNLTSAGIGDIFVSKLGLDVTPPEISISSPSPERTTTGPVTYVVSYCDEDVASLYESDITLDITGDVTAVVTVTPLGGSDWEVLLSAITGTGTLGFTIIQGTAVYSAGNFAPGASTLELVQVVPGMPLAAWPVLLTLLAAGATALHRKRNSRT